MATARSIATRQTAEEIRLREDAARTRNWKRWGPYLSERQWGTVREDYSEGGSCWDYFPHDHARSRAYRWGEDGLLGICDRQCRLAFALALWNERDPILKERLFGLTGPEGNHGEDVKELYYYLDSTPTHSYISALYKYPQAEYPYALLVEENRRRGKHEPELELADTGVFDSSRYFDVKAEYAKASPEDVLIRVTVSNRGPESARVHVLPTLWFRNTWSWGGDEGERPSLRKVSDDTIEAAHPTLGRYRLHVEPGPGGRAPELLFTENETNAARLFGSELSPRFAKDAFHELVVAGRREAVNPGGTGTKAAAWHVLDIPGGSEVVLRLRLTPLDELPSSPFGAGFDEAFDRALRDADEHHDARVPATADAETRNVLRQADAGLMWSKQFYHYVVDRWVDGDPRQPAPPDARRGGRNADWSHLHAKDVLSMPDAWEYPWFAAWDLAFHAIPLARLDPEFAKHQLLLMLREWYMHPNGQIPAYEFAFGDVNPPVHAWAAWRVYKMTGRRGARDRAFLSSVFQKLLLNFTWWVNRKDTEGRHLFSGGFLGLDNIGVFDRSRPLPTGGHLEQADGTAWMAFYCLTMMAMALELSKEDPAAADMASKFFEHFVAIADAMNTLGGSGLWDEEDGFYYDQLHVGGNASPLKVRSMVGIIPLFAAEVLDDEVIERLPGFRKRMEWFLKNRPELARQVHSGAPDGRALRLLAVPSRNQLERVLRRVLDETEFLSPHGVRSVSRVHRERPFVLETHGERHEVTYVPGESDTGLFGGNSNWRGPVWFPVNYLLVEALERYHHFYGDDLRVECPAGSGTWLNLHEVSLELSRRLAGLFLPGAEGRRPCHGGDRLHAEDPQFRDLVLFHEYFDGDTGRGVGASHQTGWTALVTRCLEDLARAEAVKPARPGRHPSLRTEEPSP